MVVVLLFVWFYLFVSLMCFFVVDTIILPPPAYIRLRANPTKDRRGENVQRSLMKNLVRMLTAVQVYSETYA